MYVCMYVCPRVNTPVNEGSTPSVNLSSFGLHFSVYVSRMLVRRLFSDSMSLLMLPNHRFLRWHLG